MCSIQATAHSACIAGGVPGKEELYWDSGGKHIPLWLQWQTGDQTLIGDVPISFVWFA